MTGSAICALLHRLHGHNLPPEVGLEWIWVAILAAKSHLDMNGMAELDLSDFFVPPGQVPGMADCTILHGKGCISIMTGPAVFPFLHCRHGYFLPLELGLEQGRMTFITAESHLDMIGVAERGGSRYLTFPGNFTGMTGRALPDGKSHLAIMAGATVSALLHCRHGHFLAVMPRRKQFRMTIVAAETHGQMQGVAEPGYAGVILLPLYFTHRVTEGTVLQ